METAGYTSKKQYCVAMALALTGVTCGSPAQAFDSETESSWEKPRAGPGARWSGEAAGHPGSPPAGSGSYDRQGWRQPSLSLIDGPRGGIAFLLGQAPGTPGNVEWGIGARYHGRPARTEFSFYWLYQRERVAYPAGAQAGALPFPWAGPGLGSESPGRALPLFFPPPLEDQPRGAAEGRNAFSYLAVHLQRLSALYDLPPTSLWDSATLHLEAGRLRHNGSRSESAFVPGSGQSRAVQILFNPAWSEALPNLELSVPIALSYSLKSQVPLPGVEGRYKGGRFSIGASAVYDKAWNADLRYIHFFGESDTPLLRDRNFLWLSIQRTF